ncbi:MAG: alpha/beta fold hydrolase [Acidobacteria bacterium]|nr:alpha/beta fold hydrolase [Acidobacteriota bacterium]
MARLSSPISQIKDHYEVVVVGSGYGGGISASRLARAGRRVCLLERGKEFQPGEYPDTEPEAVQQMQADFPAGHVGSHHGLYDFRVNEEINVFLGCGLGGTSLVNANVVLRAEPRVFDDPRWPQEVRADLNTLIEDGYRRAVEMLRPTPLPERYNLPKLTALETSARAVGENFYRPPINVTFDEPEGGVNHVGVEQHACKLCGDCVTGCNYHAKNTTLMNYLPDARNHGAEIYTQVSVRRLGRENDRWVVHYQLVEEGREKFDAPELFVTADVVVLSAGTLGSTEILLRSKAAGLPLSDALGEGFTGNGDVLAFGYNNDQEINGVGFGQHPPEGRELVGPTITGIIDAREKQNLDAGMVVEEGAVPGALGPTLPAGLAAVSAAVGVDTDSGLVDFVNEKRRELESLVRGPYHGAARNTQTYLIMAHDDSDGRMYLEDDRLRIGWPGVGSKPIFETANDLLEDATRPLGGTYVKDPIWSKPFKKDLITVHPLGGCRMATSAEAGVVNHKGQVFSGAAGGDVYEGLYVSDGAVVPRSLGVNPLLTISALAERCCVLMAQDRGWTIDYEFKPVVAQPQAAHVGVQFTERMHGYFSTRQKDDYQAAAELGREEDSTLEFVLTISTQDLERAMADPAHEYHMAGTVKCPALSPRPLTVTEGTFNLFTVDPDHVDTTNMRYRMKLTDETGKGYFFHGFKVVHDNTSVGADLWADTTTLYTTVYEGADDSGPVVGKGILRISPDDFARQLTTMQVLNAANLKQRLEYTAKFGRHFSKALFDTYGGILLKPNVFDPTAPPRKRRPLRVSAPEVHFFTTGDDVQLRLTRYQGGKKGPVILSHGLGVSSLIFSIDTIETNLLEYLYAHGFDVWLLDYRASIDLPSSKTQFSGDEIATQDYPAAVRKVLEVTGADSVQMVAHCFGSTTFFMAMLAGLKGVRSAVCSQIATNIVAPVMTRIKTGLHMPSVLGALGVDSLNAYVDKDAKWYEKLYDRALDVMPMQLEERCNNATCHRITFMYSNLYEHDQLNEATHEALHEMFGIANTTSFEHLAALVRKGHLVSAKGEEVYMNHLDRLAIPISFIHGAENNCFLPESTEKTVKLLGETNGSKFYTRHVIPGYGHIDCIYGKNAAEDVYPFILHHLEGAGA